MFSALPSTALVGLNKKIIIICYSNSLSQHLLIANLEIFVEHIHDFIVDDLRNIKC